MCANKNDNVPEQSRQPLVLQNICLDLKLKAKSYRDRFVKFLKKNRSELNLNGDEDIVAAYFDRIWPNGAPGSMIVSNASFDKFDRWIIRPPAEGPMAATFAVNGLIPTFSGYRRQGTIVIDDFRTTDHIPPRRFERYVSGTIHTNLSGTLMTQSDFAVLAQLPSQRLQVNQQLQSWRECLDWRRRLVFIGQRAFRYEGYERGDDGNIRFLVRANGKLGRIAGRNGMVILATPLTSSLSPGEWIPIPDARPSFTRVGQVIKVQHSEKASHLARKRDSAEDSEKTPRMAIVTIRSDRNGDELFGEAEAIPQEGFLLSSVGGDMKPINSEHRGLNRLCKGQSHNWYLPDFMFDIGNAAVPLDSVDVLADSSPAVNLNKEQRLAVNKATAAPDFALVQGPPGTGKTTVIVMLCYEEVRRGRRVLVVSQANGAVDHVLIQLSRDPAVRPLRIGKINRVDDEGQIFLAENALRPWFQSIVHTCRQRVHDAARAEQIIGTAEEAFMKLEGILERSQETLAAIESQTRRRTKLADQQNSRAAQREESARKLDQSRRRQAVLTELSRLADGQELQVQSTDLLTDTSITKLASTAVRKMAKILSTNRWVFSWLTDSERSDSGNLFSILGFVKKTIRAAESLADPVSEAISLCSHSSELNKSPEAIQIAELLERRAILINSADDNDLLEVAGINRRIKELQDNSWGRVCRLIHDNLQVIFQNKLPRDLDYLTASLQPNDEHLPVLRHLSQLCEYLVGSCQEVMNDALARIGKQANTEAVETGGEIDELRQQIGELKAGIDELDYQITEVEHELQGLQEQSDEFLRRWSQLWPDACPDLSQYSETVPEISTATLRDRRNNYDTWLRANANTRQRADKWRSIQQDWNFRLEKPETAEDKDLNRLYVANANVVGLTCLESGQRSFYESDDFEPFDTVIIDEVSKATPTELLMAMMQGRKVILVGDHRQLPPMFRERESSFAEAVADGQINPEDFERFGKLITSSFFQNLFEAAPDSIRQSLLAQYRMHPQIMDIINQFYDGRLIAAGGIEYLGRLRQHYLSIKGRRGGRFLEPNQHVLWIDSTKRPNGRQFFEKQSGSSKVNLLEVELIIAALLRLNKALCERGYGPVKEAKASAAEKGITLESWIKRTLPHAKPETISDLFSRRQVKINGHIASADYTVRTGDTVRVDARMPIGIITFYGAQLGQIRSRIAQLIAKDPRSLDACYIQTNTVDKFQGKEMPIVFVSLVRAPQNRHVSKFVKEYRRINVALSRAQNLLIIVGSERTFRNVAVELPSLEDGIIRQIPVYRNIFDLITQFGGRRYARDLLKW